MGSGSSAMSHSSLLQQQQEKNGQPLSSQQPLLLRHSIDFIDEQEMASSPRPLVSLTDERDVPVSNWSEVDAQWAIALQCIKSTMIRDASMTAQTIDQDTDVDSWHFDVWRLDDVQLISLGLMIFGRHFQSSSTVYIDIPAMHRLFIEVRHYMTRHQNSYHNFYHVIDVMQSCSAMMYTFRAKDWIQQGRDVDIFTLFLSAMMHDLDHSGLNNMYHVNAVTPLAIRYNDVSVLENYHCALACEILHGTSFNVLPQSSISEKKAIRKQMIAYILATDMSQHFSIQNDILQATDRIRQGSLTKENCSEKDRTLLLKSILHCADISNPSKPWAISKKWSDLVIEEFFQQGDREKREQLPVSMNCDRDTTKQDELSLNFADFIIIPYNWAMLGWIPDFAYVCKTVGANRHIWNEMLMMRLQSADMEDVAKKETIGKWAARASAFEEKLKLLG